MYNKSSDKLEKEFNIVKIIKNLKDLRILIKNKFIDDLTKFQINHNTKNIIDLEDTSSSGSNDHFKKNDIAVEDLDTLKQLDEMKTQNNTKMLTGILSKG